ncbi:Imm8 family immunity protein [Thalassolituus sp.]|jgi:hypothetical protein|uniref:Imm8 family immunity protein n=1 Tax=Thalassolituus sp. TaxID=2030822 RepID=UPI002A823EDE|nr:Imm8 family immunity protein [Thalassolituus sp.]
MEFEAYQLSIINQSWGDDIDEFFIQAHCEVRQKGVPGGEAFGINIVSPKFFVKELGSNESVHEYGRGYLFATDYDENSILSELQKLIDGSHAKTWDELLAYIEKYFSWIA